MKEMHYYCTLLNDILINYLFDYAVTINANNQAESHANEISEINHLIKELLYGHTLLCYVVESAEFIEIIHFIFKYVAILNHIMNIIKIMNIIIIRIYENIKNSKDEKMDHCNNNDDDYDYYDDYVLILNIKVFAINFMNITIIRIYDNY
ncbi:hypothetical protein U3516DRAFT_770909 [Neocallimastix sp. 'constans']